MDEDAAQAAGASPHERDAEGNKRDYVIYGRSDNGAGDNRGVWLNFCNATAESQASFLTHGKYGGLLDGCVHGTPASSADLRALSRGVDPRTLDEGENGKPSLAREKRIYNAKSRNGVFRDPAGYDLQMAPPKDVSVIGLTADRDERQTFTLAHQEAYVAALEWAWHQGYFVTRKLNGKTGRVEYTPVAQAAMATFTHFTSRENDPQIHNHTAVMKMALDRDGNVCALDNFLLKRHGGAIVAMYRTELVSRLKVKMSYMFVRDGTDRDGRNFRIAGFPTAVRELFSKRRAQVLGELATMSRSLGVSLDAATNREAAQIASYSSRTSKQFIPIEQLVETWRGELGARGWPRETLVRAMEGAGRCEPRRRLDDPALRRSHLREGVTREISKILADRTTLSDARLLRAAGETLQTEAQSAREVMAVLQDLEQANALVAIRSGPEGRTWTTRTVIETELGMLATAWRRRDEREGVDKAIVDATVQTHSSLTPDQANAVRHALGRNGVSAVVAPPGADKSVVGALVAAWTQARPQAGVWTLGAPSHANQTSSGPPDDGPESGMPVAQFLAAVAAGEITLASGDLVILERAGEIDLWDFAGLVGMTDRYGVKLAAFGDSARKRARSAGAPFCALQRIIGAARLGDGRGPSGRTFAEARWMAASAADLAEAATGGEGGAIAVLRAVEAYERAGKVAWAPNKSVAEAAAVNKLLRHRAHHPGESRAIITERPSDAQTLANAVRLQLLEQGLLSKEAVRFPAVPFGPGRKAVEIELRSGDDVILSGVGDVCPETDAGRIVSIADKSSRGSHPVITIRLCSGRTVSAGAEDFAANPREGATQVPRLQHSYALPWYALHDVSMDYAIDLHLRARGAGGTHVGASRHRKELDIIVDCERIERERPSQERATALAHDNGGPQRSVALDRIKQRFFAEACEADQLGNVSDHFTREELCERLSIPLSSSARSLAQDLERRMMGRLAAPRGYEAQWPDRSGRFSAVAYRNPFGAQHPAAGEPIQFSARPLSAPALALASRLAGVTGEKRTRMTQGPPSSPNAPAEIHARQAREAFIKLASTPSPWLVQILGIAPDIVKRLATDIRRDGGDNPDGAVFAQRDRDGALMTLLRVGPGDEERSSGRSSTETNPYLFQAGDSRAPKQIYLAQSNIEVLSLYQLDKQPDRTLLVASDGALGLKVLNILEQRAAKSPSTAWTIGLRTDGDDGFAAAARNAILRGNPDAQIIERLPAPQYNNWNDTLRGATFEQATKLAGATERYLTTEAIEETTDPADRFRIGRPFAVPHRQPRTR